MKLRLRKTLIHAGIEEDADIWLGRAITVIFLFSIVPLIAPFLISQYSYFFNIDFSRLESIEIVFYYSLPLFLLSIVFISFLYYIYIFYRVQDRTDAIEKILPDFLLIMVSNLHAGLSPFSAFVNAARPEFGPLEEEIRKVAVRISSSQSLALALTELSERVNSVIFQKTIIFFEKAVRSGGHMAKILIASAEEIRRTQEMRQELFSQVKGYLIFLGFITIFIAPFLLSMSSQFLVMFMKIKAQTSVAMDDTPVEVPIFHGELNISPVFVEYISIAFLILSSLLISFFIGSILRGKPLYGIKYFPLFVFTSTVMYFICKSVIAGMLFSFTGTH